MKQTQQINNNELTKKIMSHVDDCIKQNVRFMYRYKKDDENKLYKLLGTLRYFYTLVDGLYFGDYNYDNYQNVLTSEQKKKLNTYAEKRVKSGLYQLNQTVFTKKYFKEVAKIAGINMKGTSKFNKDELYNYILYMLEYFYVNKQDTFDEEYPYIIAFDDPSHLKNNWHGQEYDEVLESRANDSNNDVKQFLKKFKSGELLKPSLSKHLKSHLVRVNQL